MERKTIIIIALVLFGLIGVSAFVYLAFFTSSSNITKPVPITQVPGKGQGYRSRDFDFSLTYPFGLKVSEQKASRSGLKLGIVQFTNEADETIPLSIEVYPSMPDKSLLGTATTVSNSKLANGRQVAIYTMTGDETDNSMAVGMVVGNIYLLFLNTDLDDDTFNRILNTVK